MALAASELALQNTDLLVISSYLTPADVGIYFAAAKTMSLILFVHFAVGSAVAQRFSALKARGDDAELRAFVKDAVNWTFWPSLAAALIILVLGLPLLSLFGSEFTSGYPVMFILGRSASCCARPWGRWSYCSICWVSRPPAPPCSC